MKHTISIRNTGAKKLRLGNIRIVKGSRGAGDFIITIPPDKKLLDPGAGTNFTIDFKPTATGTRKAALLIRSNDRPRKSFMINLVGIGVSR